MNEIFMYQIICGIFIITTIIIIDSHFYGKTKYPERTKWYYKLPLGGFVAYLKFGK